MIIESRSEALKNKLEEFQHRARFHGPLDLRFLEGTGRSGRRSSLRSRAFTWAWLLEAKRGPVLSSP